MRAINFARPVSELELRLLLHFHGLKRTAASSVARALKGAGAGGGGRGGGRRGKRNRWSYARCVNVI
jgi:hypothetical protein